MNKRTGFTIVELLIVIVVIAILAAITIVAYNGISNRAKEASIKSDLRGSIAQLENENTTLGVYPVDSTAANQGQGLKVSSTTTLQYTLTPYGYCMTATATGVPSYVVRSNTKEVTTGDCNATTTTLSGSGAFAYQEGSSSTAQFQSPWGVAVGANDVTYITDGGGLGSRIRAIAADGTSSFIAGTSTNAFQNGTGAGAQFNYPRGLAINKTTGNLYVADSGNHRIRMVTPAGVVSTVAGTGVNGFNDGAAGSAQFSFPNGVAVGADGTLYIADSGSNRRIRTISPSGTVSTLAGATAGTFGCFNGDPALDSAGNIYVADACHEQIKKITPAGVVSVVAGVLSTQGYVDGAAASARFDNPSNIIVDKYGTLYVSEIDGGRIRKITTTGTVSTVATGLSWPYGLDINSQGALILGDSESYRVKKITF